MNRILLSIILGTGICAAMSGCGAKSDASPANEAAGEHMDGSAGDNVPTNRIDIPPAVRQNLGITFVKAEARWVEQTLRVPGRFEYLPTARREYRTMLPGRVEIAVEQFARVEQGTVLYRIDSPAWREVQQQITDAEAAIERATARLASFPSLRQAHQHHERQLQRVIAIHNKRIKQLEMLAEAGGGRLAELSEVSGAAATAEADLAEVLEREAELAAAEAGAKSDLTAAKSNYELLIDLASTLLSMSEDELTKEVDSLHGPRPRWRTITTIEVKARDAGVVESLGLTDGAWANEEVAVLTIVQPERLRFRAVALQSDLGRLRDGASARIVAPSLTQTGGSFDVTATMDGPLKIDLAGDPGNRTVDLFVTPQSLAPWARAGVSSQLEIVTDESSAKVLAIPSAAIQKDGLVPVFFRRDPADPNKAIRVEADLGLDDGRWTVVGSGLRLGDEIVLEGAYQLLLASANSGQDQGGHFHADGTFHSGEDE